MLPRPPSQLDVWRECPLASPPPPPARQEPSSFYHVVTGPPGGGKTTLLREACREVGRGVGYLDVPPAYEVDFGRDLGAAFNFRRAPRPSLACRAGRAGSNQLCCLRAVASAGLSWGGGSLSSCAARYMRMGPAKPTAAAFHAACAAAGSRST